MNPRTKYREETGNWAHVDDDHLDEFQEDYVLWLEKELEKRLHHSPEAGQVDAIVMLPLPDSMERMESGPVQFGDDWPGIFLRGDEAMAMSLYISTAISALEDVGNYVAAENLRGYEKRLKECKAT